MDKDINIYTVNGIKYLKFKRLEEYKNIEHGFYLGKSLDFKTRDKYKNNFKDNYINYKKFFECFGLDYKLCVKPLYEHSNNSKIVSNKHMKDEPDFFVDEYENTDALITDKDNIILTSTSADCNIVLIYDVKNKVIANVHSGWLGTLNSITKNTILNMIDNYNSDTSNLIVAFMPSIRMCHFEVDEDVYLKFYNKYKKEEYYNKKGNKWHIDLVKIIKDELLDIGVDSNNILDCNMCTVCNGDTMHSYRVEKDNFGLNMGFICKKEEII